MHPRSSWSHLPQAPMKTCCSPIWYVRVVQHEGMIFTYWNAAAVDAWLRAQIDDLMGKYEKVKSAAAWERGNTHDNKHIKMRIEETQEAHPSYKSIDKSTMPLTKQAQNLKVFQYTYF